MTIKQAYQEIGNEIEKAVAELADGEDSGESEAVLERKEGYVDGLEYAEELIKMVLKTNAVKRAYGSFKKKKGKK